MDVARLIFCSAIITAFVFFIIAVIRSIKSKRKIELEVNNCTACPFRYKKESMIHESCKLHNITENSNDNFSDLISMKNNCPIKGKLKITVEKL